MLINKLFLLSLFLGICHCETIKSLGGEWLLKDDAEEYKDLKATVPGGIYSDLMDNNVLDNIFFGNNDQEYRWVARKNWTYYTTFQVDQNILDQEVNNLIFDGLDTICTITVNDVEVGSGQNMFVRYVFDVKDQIQLGENTISVKFTSPIEYVDKMSADFEDKNGYYVPPQCVPDAYKGECHVNFIRKMQSSYSWDWGPAFPSVGIWKEVFLEAYNTSAIRYVVSEVLEESDDSWNLSIDTYFATPASDSITGELLFSLVNEGDPIESKTEVTLDQPNDEGEYVVSTNITVPKSTVNTWWPNGYGDQPLYDLNAVFTSGSEDSIKNERIGFRKIELIQDDLPNGLTFYFKVNDVPIFAMGTNIVPVDILPERGLNKSRVQFLLKSCKDTNMNMVRIWGGGVYESDYFYDVADELGLLLWQDYTFASSMYPANDEFLSNAKEEVKHQVKRLQSHASLAAWSGNNENEGNLHSGYFNTSELFDTFKEDYIKLYIDVIKTQVERLTKTAIFLDSSASNGKKSDEEGYVSDNPNSEEYGDSHYYNYNKDSFDANIYPVPRFMSEYGFQSFPSISSWLTVTNNTDDLDVDSNFMEMRQHHPNGNDQMKTQIENQFNLPSEDHPNYSKAYMYYTEIIQAYSTKIESEHFRRFMARTRDDSKGYTMGALYWQLNDVWIAPSWGAIDHTLKWKLCQYLVADFFSPNLITAHYHDNLMEIFVVLNLPEGPTDGWIQLTVYKWDSLTPVSTEKIDVEFSRGQSNLVSTINATEYLSNAGCGDDAVNNCFIKLWAGNGDDAFTPENVFFPGKIKNANLATADLTIDSVTKVDDNNFDIVLKTDNIALFVVLDAQQLRGLFSKNGFILTDETITITFEALDSVTVEDLQQALTVTHLRDPQYFN